MNHNEEPSAKFSLHTSNEDISVRKIAVPEKTYTFMEVVQGLKEGKKYRRVWWSKTGFLFLPPTSVMPGNPPHIVYHSEKDDYNIFTIDDFEATDWVEV